MRIVGPNRLLGKKGPYMPGAPIVCSHQKPLDLIRSRLGRDLLLENANVMNCRIQVSAGRLHPEFKLHVNSLCDPSIRNGHMTSPGASSPK
jgi:hypothetical protein